MMQGKGKAIAVRQTVSAKGGVLYKIVRLVDAFEVEDQEESSWDEGDLDDDLEEEQPDTAVHRDQKVGRNDPCPCGSGKKYKKCCLNKQLPR